MITIDKLQMIYLGVNEMTAARKFYAEALGCKVTKDYRQDDKHWWVTLELPGGGVTITLSTYFENQKPGTSQLYFSSPDVQASQQHVMSKGAKPTDVADDLYGPGSGVKWFSVKDPDGNNLMIAQS